jgi:azurin
MMIQQGVFSLIISLILLAVKWYIPVPNTDSDPGVREEVTVCAGTYDPFNANFAVVPSTKLSEAEPAFLTDYQEEAIRIWLEVVPEQMKFDQDTFTVKAGKKVILELDNLDGMQHNLLILSPNSLDKVGAAADAMLRDPNASEKHYIPDMPEVLFATEMLGPNEVYTLTFTAPKTAGHYPFVCTFPGHWRMMRGIMVVEKS